MLIQTNFKSHIKSKYRCDSCEKEITTEDRVRIDKNTKKKYDLCKDCWRKIRIIVEKHKLRKEE